MFTKNTHLMNVTPAGNSNASDDMNIEKDNTFQHPFLMIVAAS